MQLNSVSRTRLQRIKRKHLKQSERKKQARAGSGKPNGQRGKRVQEDGVRRGGEGLYTLHPPARTNEDVV